MARGHRVHATADDALSAQPPNIVTFFQVLEHMTHPEVALAEVADALAAGGVIVIETWDRTSRIARLFGRRWQQANPPSVIHLFSRVGVRRLVERAGFEVISVDTTSKLVSAGLVAGIAAQRWGTVGRAMRTFAEATRLAKVAVPYRFGDLITVIAVKRVVSPGK
jgi:SAM-dependent methyltransferase